MIETLVRVKSAVSSLPFISPEQEGLVNEWYNQLLFPSNPEAEETLMYLGSSAAMDELICYVENGKKNLATQLLKIMQASNFRPIEEKLLKKAFQEFKEGEIAAWLRIGSNKRETGWLFKGLFPLVEALKMIPDSDKSDQKEKLSAWYAKYEADACVKVGRCVSSGAYTMLHTELFGDNTEEDIEIYGDLMHTLGIAPLPEPLLDLILEEAPEYIEVSYWMAANGVLRTGLYIPDPSLDLIMKSSLVIGGGAIDDLAAFEGSLGVEKVRFIEFYRTAEGIGAEFQY